MRADMWRYAVLYLYGGVYADVDVLAKPRMADLVNEVRLRPPASHDARSAHTAGASP